MTNFSPKEILIKTKEALKTRGWFQGNFVEPAARCGVQRVCFIGAMNLALRGNPYHCNPNIINDNDNERIALNAVVHTAHESDRAIDNVVQWNDHPLRTIEEVYQTIDQAIEKLK